MLVKCVCSNCSHSYLADDQMGDLACPRCGAAHEEAHNPSGIPGEPMSHDVGVYDSIGEEEVYGVGPIPRFDPKAPPPMYLTVERILKGFVFGFVAAVGIGFVVGGALAAIQVMIPGVAALVVGLAGGAACRYGFGGRATPRTFGRAIVTVALVMALGLVGILAGAWTIERVTGVRAAQTRADLDTGLSGIRRQRAEVEDAGMAIVFDQRISEVERLKTLTDAQLEDYLWVQQGQLNQPPLAYVKLRVMEGPAVQLGANR